MKTIIENRFPKKIAVIILGLILSSSLFAQDPDWMVVESDYEHTMTFLSFLTIDGNRLASENDRVGVFVDGVCRGTTHLTYVESQDSYFAFLTVFANVGGETMDVQIYDSVNDEVRDVSTTFNFEINSHIGNLFQAVSWADPVLNSQAEILNFSFEDIVSLDEEIANQSVTIFLEEAIDITALIPLYELSAEADMFINSAPQTSGQDQLDFTNPITYQVRSQDQSTVSVWTVNVENVANNIVYRKKNAVCYEGGAIRITSTQNGADAILMQNDTVLDTKAILNQEVLFEDLDVGTYQVQIGNSIKDIEINFN